MSNMSYCRFQNTAADLEDCAEADGMHDPADLSAEEKRARLRLIDLCKEIASYYGDE